MKRPPKPAAGTEPEGDLRRRILQSAMSAFMEHGFSNATTLDIATRARVSKRELYAVVGNKQQMLAACIDERARRMRAPADVPVPRDRESLAATLRAFGAALLREVTDRNVIAVYRLAAAEAERSPDVARALDQHGREPTRAALNALFEAAQSGGLLAAGDANAMARDFIGLLWSDQVIRLILGVIATPDAKEVQRRAREATEAFLRIYGVR